MSTDPFQSKLQNLVYNVDAGIGQRFIKISIFVLALISLMAFYTFKQFHGLSDHEAMDYAQLGRTFQQTGHFATKCIRPASVRCLEDERGKFPTMMTEHPDLFHPPLYPMLLAAGFSIIKPSFAVANSPRETFRPEQWVIVPLGHLCTLLTGLVLFLTGRKLFDQRIAVLGTTLFFLSNAVWKMSISGLAIPLATLLVTLAAYFTVVAVQRREADENARAWAVYFALAVLTCVLAVLTRYGTAVVVPGLALYVGLSFKSARWQWAAVFILAAMLGVSPWMIRNKMVCGQFFGLSTHVALNGDDPMLDNSYERSLHPDLRKGVVVAELKTRVIQNFLRFYDGSLRTVGDGWVIGLFFATCFYRFAKDPVHRLRWGLLLAIFTLLGVGAFLGEATIRLLHVLWPMILLYGAAFYYVLQDRLQLQLPIQRYAVTAALVALSAAPLGLTLALPRAGIPYPPYYAPYISHICRMLTDDELLCSDIPWATAWYGNRNSLLLPKTIDDFYEVHFKTKLISGIYFTTVTRDRPYIRTLVTGEYKSWFPIQEGRIPGDFPLTQGFPLSNRDQLFLTDRARWKEMEQR